MMDDSLLIFEPPIRNSGIVGGKFLERQRVYKPESEEIYTFQVGRIAARDGGSASGSHQHDVVVPVTMYCTVASLVGPQIVTNVLQRHVLHQQACIHTQ